MIHAPFLFWEIPSCEICRAVFSCGKGKEKVWQTNFNRHVKKEKKSIRILAPVPYKVKGEQDRLDPVTGEVMLDENDMLQFEG